jgi:Rps23 Pro-64 3,4-dihydroxylase Tpa1-like proline 4-hydroxylase
MPHLERTVQAKDECINELSFTEKETDIYKVRLSRRLITGLLIFLQVQQTGDLASLSYLGAEQLALLPSLLRLRDCLYSPEFRDFVRTVTGCGPISGSKQDMSVNTYKQGCHLLSHDDVIGTRRVSYILYMPLPYGTKWQTEWGGALEMYDTEPGPSGVPQPTTIPVASVPPSWNQFIFFEVQPGRSFHSVEEVVVDPTDGRQRLSISGWFHAAQEGEDGYDNAPTAELQSSLEQLVSSHINHNESLLMVILRHLLSHPSRCIRMTEKINSFLRRSYPKRRARLCPNSSTLCTFSRAR